MGGFRGLGVGCRCLIFVRPDKKDSTCNMEFDSDTFSKKCSTTAEKIEVWTKMR